MPMFELNEEVLIRLYKEHCKRTLSDRLGNTPELDKFCCDYFKQADLKVPPEVFIHSEAEKMRRQLLDYVIDLRKDGKLPREGDMV